MRLRDIFSPPPPIPKVRDYTYGEFLVLYQCCSEEMTAELNAYLDGAEKPSDICRKFVPDNLNLISYGELDDLSRMGKDGDPACRCLEILLEVDPVDVYRENVVKVFGFLNFVCREVKRINNLFSGIRVSVSSEELAAGIESLDFGTFGVVDWYAQRMGITNHDEVFEVPWIRIYTCMKNDNEKSEYESRLNKQYSAKIKKK